MRSPAASLCWHSFTHSLLLEQLADFRVVRHRKVVAVVAVVVHLVRVNVPDVQLHVDHVDAACRRCLEQRRHPLVVAGVEGVA
jgi:hypothetical protein